MRRQGGGKGPRYGKRVDTNQLEIVKALEQVGCDVCELGWPLDLLVGYRRRNWLLEIKDPEKTPSERKLTTEELQFINTWRGQWAVVETAAQAIATVTGK